MKKILVVCAHPDDETLGLGGTLALHAKKGDKIMVLIFATGQFGRDDSSKGIEKRKNQCKNACSVLGVKKVKFLDYEDQALESVKLTELSSKIEEEIRNWKPSVLYTHFWGDTNQDHRRIYEAVLISTRPTSKYLLQKVVCFETPSSTDWGSKSNNFHSNMYVNIEKTIKMKIKAFSHYENEIRRYPSPISKKSLLSRAEYWGSKVGISYAEPFIILREIND
jgi:LmbE family N-acetylglucosaminyl deacetylase